MPTLEIDGKMADVPNGSTIMEAAARAGVYIPHFCYHRKLSIAANCRMCLVEVEKAPKPLPACSTPVANGMKVFTHSPAAVAAQKGVMEFLLINHPLDCPICDQGGECQLQDLAVGYGASGSRYTEAKRVVVNKYLGPLISTDMTRCIHCTRCVRFGTEIAGVMELGMVNRGEHAEIITFVGRTVDSELSGNVIDLCPVGALTSKPFRYSARPWELTNRRSVSPHCGLGSNLIVQTRLNEVMRVLPLDNEAINECWLSDKDRFSYQGLNSDQRLSRPMLKQDGVWKEVDWQPALEFVAAQLQRVRDTHGADSIAMLATPHQTLEELFLLGKLARGFANGNVDCRLRQADFSAANAGVPWLGMKVAEVGALDRVLLVGTTLRKDHPLLAHRLRQAAKRRLQANLINPVDDDLLMRVANKSIVAPSSLARALAEVLKAVAEAKGVPLPAEAGARLANVEPGGPARRIAESLASGKNIAVLLGNIAQYHPQAAQLHMLAQLIARVAGAKLGFLGAAANGVGGYLAGATTPSGTRQLLEQPRKAYVLLGVEPELDCHDPALAVAAMRQAEFVVAMSAYRHAAVDYANVLLPVSPFTETSGTFVNTEGTVQSFAGAVQPLGDTRPAWKVLRVLGNLLGMPGFEHETNEDVRAEALGGGEVGARLDNELREIALRPLDGAGTGIERIGEVPIYQADPIVRRAVALQKTRDAQSPQAAMNGVLFEQLGLRDGDAVRIVQGGGEAVLTAARDDRLPPNCVRVPAAHPLTAALGGMFGTITAARVGASEPGAG